MSPEISMKSMYDGLATDIWASGIILYTMLFGVQPFRGSNEQDLFRKIQKGMFKIPSISTDKDTFETYLDIENASTIKNLLTDILQV
jgi:serine/threonine protein kinase